MQHSQTDLQCLDYYKKNDHESFILEAAMISDTGKVRKINEDHYSAKVFTSLENDTPAQLSLFIVCDGMGGMNAGEIASKIAIDSLNEFIIPQFQECSMDFSKENIEMILDVASKFANDTILKESERDSSKNGMGTTALIVLGDGNKYYFAHIGDSRLYLIKKNKISQLTQDHTLINEIKNKEIFVPKNIITRALGATLQVELDLNQKKSPVILSEGNMLLLCTDGLYNELTDQEILQIIKNNLNSKEAVEKLVEEANKKGGNDNITVILLKAFESKPF